MGRLDEVIIKLSDVFEEYNTDDGKKRLDKEEFDALVQNEVNVDNFQGNITLQNIMTIFKQMDRNNDGELKLLEFCRAVSQLVVLYHRKKHGHEN
ncbi:protein S100-G-like [Phyllopteryx taeniolatus]|uniref:protein S100-G-like n=1 Tax=Phyllopteryx taeniolatus TaxID=161469 RepID=UPI002AD2694D|nr:protein S100-G-like [Phyllopteryx taeniolatus]